MLLPWIVRSRLATHAANNCSFRVASRHRHQTVAPVPAQLSFHAALFVALGRGAVLAPVRTECDDPVGLHSLPAAEESSSPGTSYCHSAGCGIHLRNSRTRARDLPARLAAWRWYTPDGRRRPTPC